MKPGGDSHGPNADAPVRVAPTTRRWLLAAARHALADAMGAATVAAGDAPDDPCLDEPARTFVSWHDGPRLVGCIGTLHPERSLRAAVVHFSVQAGLHDPRTPTPVAADLPRLSCEISVLGAPAPMEQQGLPAITAALVPGRDGLVLYDGARRAVFLPLVWASLPAAPAFVAALCQKAGIDPDVRGPHVRAERFFADRFDETAT